MSLLPPSGETLVRLSPELTPKEMLSLGVFLRQVHVRLPRRISSRLVHTSQTVAGAP